MVNEGSNGCSGTYTGVQSGVFRVVFDGEASGNASSDGIAPVPYEVFKEKNEALKASNAMIAQLREELAAIEATSAEEEGAGQEEESPFIERADFNKWVADQKTLAEKINMDHQLQFMETKLDEIMEQHPEFDRDSLEIKILKNPDLLNPKKYKVFIAEVLEASKKKEQEVINRYVEGKKAAPAGSTAKGSSSPETQPKTLAEARAASIARFAAAAAAGD